MAAGRLVVAHPLHTNAFLDTHAYNFPFVENFVDGKNRRGWGWFFFLCEHKIEYKNNSKNK